jgi:hypothetical protein
MSSAMMQEVLEMIEAEAHSRPTPFEYELAYQARVAIDRIRFAIQHTEKFAPHTDHMREAGLQLLDALDRLKSAEHRFQRRFRPHTANDEIQKTDPKLHIGDRGQS